MPHSNHLLPYGVVTQKGGESSNYKCRLSHHFYLANLATVRLSKLYSRGTCPGWPHLGAATWYEVLGRNVPEFGAERLCLRRTWSWSIRGGSTKGRIDRGVDRPVPEISHESRDVLLRLYKYLVHWTFNAASLLWSPYYKKDQYLLEHVQHRVY